MKDFQLTHDNFSQFVKALQEELAEHNHLSVTAQAANTGKWGMAKLWRVWMKSTAEFMANNGCTMPLMVGAKGKVYGSRPFNADDAHELFCSNFMGVDSDGKRISWSKSGRDGMRPATKSERFFCLMKMEQWMLEKGISTFIPSDSQYMIMRNDHDGVNSSD